MGLGFYFFSSAPAPGSARGLGAGTGGAAKGGEGKVDLAPGPSLVGYLITCIISKHRYGLCTPSLLLTPHVRVNSFVASC